MKLILVALVVCAFVSTGLSKPVESEQLPPIGGPLMGVHPVMVNLAKETLVKVAENLKAAGRLEDAAHLNLFVDETERIMQKAQDGDVHASEAHELDEHLEAIYEALEHYKAYLPVQKTLQLIVPTNEQLVEHLRVQLDELIAKLKENKENAKAKVLTYYKKLLMVLQKNKANLDSIVATVATEMQRYGEELRARFNKKTEKTDKMAIYSNESGDLIRGLLQGLVQDLEKIEAGLKSDGKYIEYGRIKLYKNIVKAVAANTHGGNANRKSVQYALDRGIELIKKYEKYLSKNLLSGTYGGADFFRRKMLGTVINNLQKIENGLKKDRKLIDYAEVKLHKNVCKAVAASTHIGNVLGYQQALDRGLNLVSKHVKYLAAYSGVYSLYADEDDHMPHELDIDEQMNDEEVDENELPDEDEAEKSMNILQKMRQKLEEVQDKLRSRRRFFKVSVVQTYIRALDLFMRRLKNRNLEKSRINDFILRVKEVLEKYTESQYDFHSYSLYDTEDKKDDEDSNKFARCSFPIPKSTTEKYITDKEDEKADNEDNKDSNDFYFYSLYDTENNDEVKPVEEDKKDDERLIDLDDEEDEEVQPDNPEPEDLDKEDEEADNEDDEDSNEVDEDDLPDKKTEEESLSRLEAIRNKLNDLREKLRARRRSVRAMVVDTYIRVLDRMMQRMQKHKLDKTRLNSVMERAQKMLKDYSDSLKE